jgi:hypothetical protein
MTVDATQELLADAISAKLSDKIYDINTLTQCLSLFSTPGDPSYFSTTLPPDASITITFGGATITVDKKKGLQHLLCFVFWSSLYIRSRGCHANSEWRSYEFPANLWRFSKGPFDAGGKSTVTLLC